MDTLSIIFELPIHFCCRNTLRLDHHLRPFIRGILATYHRCAVFLIPALNQLEEHRGPGVAGGIGKEVIDDEKRDAYVVVQPLVILMHIMLSEHLKLIEEEHEVHGKHPESTPAGLDAYDIQEIGLAGIRGTEYAYVQAILDEFKRLDLFDDRIVVHTVAMGMQRNDVAAPDDPDPLRR